MQGGATAEPDLERRLVDAARSGDENAFAHLVDPYRSQLHAHCYRLLGSLHDAEDAFQETMLRAWRGLGGFQAERALRPWLYRIATNACLDLIGKRPKRTMPFDHGAASAPDAGPGRPLSDEPWLQPYADEVFALPDGFAAPEARYEQRESVELAFVAALQHLPARQRAVLILREVLGFSAREVAELLETTVASVNSALQRARRLVEERRPAQSQQATLRSLGDDGLRALVQRYVEAWEARNVDALRELLADDVRFSMPPFPRWFEGRETVIAFIAATGRPRLRHVVLRANGQAAVAWYAWRPRRRRYVASSVEVLAVDGERVAEITAFASPELFPLLGLPPELEPAV